MITCILALTLCRPVHVVVVGGQADLASVRGAISFWEGRAQLQIVSTEVVTITDNPLASLEWSRPWLREDGSVTIFIIDNSDTHALLLGIAAGESQDYYGAIWVVTHGFPGEDGLAATLAHELGHVLFHLPDQTGLDIMASPILPYERHFIGCKSLALLGTPCRRLYFPMVTSHVG